MTNPNLQFSRSTGQMFPVPSPANKITDILPRASRIENITSKLNGFKPVQLGDFEHLTAEEKDHMIETFTILVLGHRKE